MNPDPAARWRQLAPLTLAVLAAHLVLLQGAPRIASTSRPEPVHFVTRTITPAPAPAVAAAAQPPAAATPTPPAAMPQPSAAPSRPRPSPGQPAPPAPPEAAAASAPPSAEPLASGSRAGLSAAVPASAPPASMPFTPQVLAIPEPARIQYEVEVQSHGFSLRGHARLDWKHDGHGYEARLEVTSPGFPSRIQRSTGRITDEGLAPSYFSDRTRSEQATHFDREQGRVVFSNNRPQAALVEGMQDRLSVLVQLSVLIAGEPARFPPGTQIAIPTASTREAESWIFRVEGEEDLVLPGGQVRALKLQRLPRREFDQKVELWLAPRMDYAPVRLRLTNPNGDAVDQRWSSTDRG